MIQQLGVGSKDGKDGNESEEVVKDEDCDVNALAIDSESKLAEVIMLVVGCSVSDGGQAKMHKKITIDCFVLPTKSLPNHQTQHRSI